MYRHLLVPLDGTELSAANTNEAVRLAAALMAQITFFYATPEMANLSVEEADQAAVILAKARAAAESAGVRCRTHTASSNQPADAILAAARHCGCDLIVMASHGGHGARVLLADSQTEAVLRQAQIPLLVTRVEANDQQAVASRAIALIQDEHRSLSAVMRGMQRLVEQARSAAPTEPGLDHVTLQRMQHYVEAFPATQHHPKEEQVLHRLLRARSRDCVPLLEQIEADHRREPELVSAVEAALFACPDGARGRHEALLVLQERISSLTQHVMRHILLEERTLFPIARQHLLESDWAEVGAAFEAHDDPHFGDLSDDNFRRLFSSIAQLMTGSQRPRANTRNTIAS